MHTINDKIIYFTGMVVNLIYILFFNKGRINTKNEAYVFIIIWSWVGTLLILIAPLLRKAYYPKEKDARGKKIN